MMIQPLGKSLFLIKCTVIFIFSLHCSSIMQAQLKQHQWKDRVILVFAPNDTELLFTQQIEALAKDQAGLLERDLVIYQVFPTTGISPEEKPLNSEATARLRKQYQIKAADFVVILIGKDGGEKLRKTQQLLSKTLLYNTIDVMPMRRSEMRRKKKGA